MLIVDLVLGILMLIAFSKINVGDIDYKPTTLLNQIASLIYALALLASAIVLAKL
jgi:hypothetical protein